MEMIDLITQEGSLTGKVAERKQIHREGLLHHASGLIILRKIIGRGYEILSQQRSYKKDKNAGLWDLSASGHVPSGQSPLESLNREIEEELGLFIKEDLHLLGKFWRHEKHGENFIENELDYIYILIKDVDIEDIKVQEEEVEEVDWLSIEDFKKKLITHEAVQRKYVWDALFEYIEKLQ